MTSISTSISDESARHPGITEALRNTLKCLEDSEELSPSDPAMIELKNSILRTIGELELRKMARSIPA